MSVAGFFHTNFACPTGNLDKKTADEIMQQLLEINRRGNTVLLVTHEEKYADMCPRKIVLSDGRIVSDNAGFPA